MASSFFGAGFPKSHSDHDCRTDGLAASVVFFASATTGFSSVFLAEGFGASTEKRLKAVNKILEENPDLIFELNIVDILNNSE